jgi:uncharacterized protein with HEPN domain
MKTDAIYLTHILECIHRIEDNMEHGRDAFMASHTLQDAVLRNLQTMTEATQRLSTELKDRHPEMPWPQISAFRNVLVHNYLGIDLDNIWAILQRDIPPLKRTIEAMQSEISSV